MCVCVCERVWNVGHNLEAGMMHNDKKKPISEIEEIGSPFLSRAYGEKYHDPPPFKS